MAGAHSATRVEIRFLTDAIGGESTGARRTLPSSAITMDAEQSTFFVKQGLYARRAHSSAGAWSIAASRERTAVSSILCKRQCQVFCVNVSLHEGRMSFPPEPPVAKPTERDRAERSRARVARRSEPLIASTVLLSAQVDGGSAGNDIVPAGELRAG